MTRLEMERRGWSELDVLLVSGDAYIDHPSFGIPLLGRLLESKGFRVGIIAQPDWKSPESLKVMGRPRLFCGIGPGCLDSMLAHYTAFRKLRHDDAYTPGGKCGKRPNRAGIVYSSLARAAFPGLPIVIGGIEASLRRLAHYDFWTDSLRRSILLDSKADLISYGMGERSLVAIANRLKNGDRDLTGIPGTCYMSATADGCEVLPSYEAILENRKLLLDATRQAEQAVQLGNIRLAQGHGNRFVITEPPSPILTSAELDAIYELPFQRAPHPSYREHIPAIDTIQWSITAMRGCAGGCSFCSLALHQSRHLTSRSADSIIREATALTKLPGWKGTITDVGGPTANLWGSSCKINGAKCRRSSCLEPNLCPNLVTAQMEYLSLLRRIRSIPGVKHVDIASGIRHDLALLEPKFVDGIVADFVGGHLKLAPEHRVPRVLQLMRKSDFGKFERFCQLFAECCRKYHKEQYIVPYVMSAFPGCTKEDMAEMMSWFRSRGWSLEQSQCFIPTPGTMATAMYYAHTSPDGKAIHVATTDKERLEQHGMMFPRRNDAPRSDRRPQQQQQQQPQRHHNHHHNHPKRGHRPQ